MWPIAASAAAATAGGRVRDAGQQRPRLLVAAGGDGLDRRQRSRRRRRPWPGRWRRAPRAKACFTAGSVSRASAASRAGSALSSRDLNTAAAASSRLARIGRQQGQRPHRRVDRPAHPVVDPDRLAACRRLGQHGPGGGVDEAAGLGLDRDGAAAPRSADRPPAPPGSPAPAHRPRRRRRPPRRRCRRNWSTRSATAPPPGSPRGRRAAGSGGGLSSEPPIRPSVPADPNSSTPREEAGAAAAAMRVYGERSPRHSNRSTTDSSCPSRKAGGPRIIGCATTRLHTPDHDPDPPHLPVLTLKLPQASGLRQSEIRSFEPSR